MPEIINRNLFYHIDECELDIRVAAALKNSDLLFLYEVTQTTKEHLLSIPNFGKISLQKLEIFLYQLDLELEMTLPGICGYDERFIHLAQDAIQSNYRIKETLTDVLKDLRTLIDLNQKVLTRLEIG